MGLLVLVLCVGAPRVPDGNGHRTGVTRAT